MTNLDKIAELFPECITESRDDNGNLQQSIDFDILKNILSENISNETEKYSFTWVGKQKAHSSAYDKNIKEISTLRPCPAESLNWDTTQNLYIEGDNLQVLQLLQESYLGKVKMIYIDPPYNTGNDFIYRDNFSMDADNFAAQINLFDDDGNKNFKLNADSNPRFHSDWCSMIYSRLIVARNFLADDGVIFISIDDNEQANLKKICDEVFGERNFVGELVWESTTQPTNTGTAKFGLQKKTESIFLYARNKSAIKKFKLEEIENSPQYLHKGKFGACRFEIIEKSDAGAYNRESMKFKILGQYPREGKRWQIGEELARNLERTGRVEIVDGIVKKAVYPEDELDKITCKPFWSFLPVEKFGTAQTGKEELNSIMEKILGFDTVKPTALIKKFLFHTTDEESIVMDFFSGSATTAHAVMALNAEDGGRRKFIMVQLPEVCAEKTEAYKAGYKNICEIGKERIRRAGEKIKADAPLFAQDLDVGFRVFKLDSTNMRDVSVTPAEFTKEKLLDLLENIKSDRTALDLLFGCLLKWGIEISKPYTEEKIDGYTVHNYNGGEFIACFDENISRKVVEYMAKKKPSRAVFRDHCFITSPDKINAREIFKYYAPNTDFKVI
ncbi:MAG: site-specific DNA-methyltransferase [Selenomonadaceae bacterium]|nr:site-specific DNA-methyltransferase [Selenomonadaceae bacterium]